MASSHGSLTGGGDADGRRNLLAEDVSGGVHLAHVSEDAWPKPETVVGSPFRQMRPVQRSRARVEGPRGNVTVMLDTGIRWSKSESEGGSKQRDIQQGSVVRGSGLTGYSSERTCSRRAVRLRPELTADYRCGRSLRLHSVRPPYCRGPKDDLHGCLSMKLQAAFSCTQGTLWVTIAVAVQKEVRLRAQKRNAYSLLCCCRCKNASGDGMGLNSFVFIERPKTVLAFCQ